MVGHGVRLLEGAGGVTPEEVALLVDVGAAGDLGMRCDEVVPPGGARLLRADADEIRRADHLARPGCRRREVEPVFPRGEAPEGVKDRVTDGSRERSEGRNGDLAQAVARAGGAVRDCRHPHFSSEDG